MSFFKVCKAAVSDLQEELLALGLGVAAGVEVVLEGDGALERADDVDLLALGPPYPVGEGEGVGHGRAQHDDVHVVRQ